MSVTERPAATRAPLAPAVVLGVAGLAWVPARYGVMTTWEGTWLGLDYGDWNRVMLIPLLLLAGGALAAARTAAGRRTRRAWTALAVGFLISGTGVLVEFVVGGGLQGGPEGIAMAGWTVYLLGQLVTGVAAVVLSAALAREGRRGAAAAAAVAGVLTLAWPAARVTPSLDVADQVLIGVAWCALGVLLRAADRPSSGS